MYAWLPAQGHMWPEAKCGHDRTCRTNQTLCGHNKRMNISIRTLRAWMRVALSMTRGVSDIDRISTATETCNTLQVQGGLTLPLSN
jgi:hypothetical protein